MKKIVLIAVVGMFLLSGMEAVALKSDVTPSNDTNTRVFTHTVFAEEPPGVGIAILHVKP